MASDDSTHILPPEPPYDAILDVRFGEETVLYGEAKAETKTVQVAIDRELPKLFLWDEDNTLLLDAADVTDYDTDPSAKVRVWYDWDTEGLAAGYYRVMFRFYGITPDGIERRYEPTILARLHG